MKGKSIIFVRLLLFSVLLMFITSNAHAFIATSELGSFTIQLVPALPNTSMSIDWTSYSASSAATAYQRSGSNSYENKSWESFDEPTNTTFTAATEHNSITAGINENETSFTFDFYDESSDYLSGNGYWNLTRDFTIQGDGWLLVSAVHSADFEGDDSFGMDYRSSAILRLLHYQQYDYSFLSEDSSELNDIMGVGYFFNDGDNGTLTAHLSSHFNNSESSHVVPIPGAVWLLGSGLFGLVMVRRRNR